MWDHIWYLGTTWATTKHSMEDLIGDAADHTSRDTKKEHSSFERSYFHLANSRRLTTTEFAHMRLQRGDLANTKLKSTMNRKEVFVAMSERSVVCSKVKDALLLDSKGAKASGADYIAAAHIPVGKTLWKPAGQTSDHKEVAALLALRECAPNNFAAFPGCWASFLLQEFSGGEPLREMAQCFCPSVVTEGLRWESVCERLVLACSQPTSRTWT